MLRAVFPERFEDWPRPHAYQPRRMPPNRRTAPAPGPTPTGKSLPALLWEAARRPEESPARRYLATRFVWPPEGIGPDFAAIPPGDRKSESCKRLPLLIQTRIGPADAGVVRACARTRPEAARNLPGSPWRRVWQRCAEYLRPGSRSRIAGRGSPRSRPGRHRRFHPFPTRPGHRPAGRIPPLPPCPPSRMRFPRSPERARTWSSASRSNAAAGRPVPEGSGPVREFIQNERRFPRFEQPHRREVIDQLPEAGCCRFDRGTEVDGFRPIPPPRHPILGIGHPPWPARPPAGDGG